MASTARVGETRLVSQDVFDGDVFLALLGKAGPVGGDLVVPVKLAPFPEDVQAGRGHSFGGGIEDEHGVLGHRLARLLVGQAAVEVQDRQPVPVDRQRRARVDPGLDLLIE